jgi:adenylate cyclase
MSNLLVMFADISESFRLYESLGDAIAYHKISQCLNTIMTVIQGHNGNVIKTMGDEVMGTFSTVEAGIAAGCEMQSYLEDQRLTQQDECPSLAIHVGMHYGPVILEKGDVFGDTVNTAKRVANMAKIGQIITTGSVAEKLSPPWRARTRHIDRVLFKGKKKRMDIFEVIWQSRDITFKRIGTGLRHEEILLSGNGHLSLGRPLSDGTKHVVHFEEIEADRAYEKI